MKLLKKETFPDDELNVLKEMLTHQKKMGHLFTAPIENDDLLALLARLETAEDAVETWDEFWKTMPKGQMGILSFDVGLFNEGFLKISAWCKAAGKGVQHER